MEFAPIEKINSLFTENDNTNNSVQNGVTDNMFASIFESAIDNVIETDAVKNDLEYKLATGQLDNPAELTIAATEASISVSLLVQLRNKALDSYSELMRMGM